MCGKDKWKLAGMFCCVGREAVNLSQCFLQPSTSTWTSRDATDPAVLEEHLLLSSSGSCALVSVTLMQRAVALPCPALVLTAPLSRGLVHLQALSLVGEELIACYHDISFHQVPVGMHLICHLPGVLFAALEGYFLFVGLYLKMCCQCLS